MHAYIKSSTVNSFNGRGLHNYKCTKAMATGILLVCVLSCVVATSFGNYLEYSKAFDELNNEFRNSQEEIKSLHEKINMLEKRLELVEVKGTCSVNTQKMFVLYIIFMPLQPFPCQHVI